MDGTGRGTRRRRRRRRAYRGGAARGGLHARLYGVEREHRAVLRGARQRAAQHVPVEVLLPHRRHHKLRRNTPTLHIQSALVRIVKSRAPAAAAAAGAGTGAGAGAGAAPAPDAGPGAAGVAPGESTGDALPSLPRGCGRRRRTAPMVFASHVFFSF
jgi:hypothetical protein